LVLGLVPGAGLIAQETAGALPEQAADTPASAAVAEVPAMTDEQLRELMGPVALYPDALIALLLPAATDPADVVMAARLVATKPTSAQIDAQPWSESVKGLARYPDVLAWMDANLAWTQQVGEVFLAQPAGVMNAVQALRAQARAAGTLTDTPQQRVVVEQQIIRIEPARVDVIYVPVYDPAVVYVRRAPVYAGSVISFSVGYPTGVWLAYSCDWGRSSVWVTSGAYRTPYYYRPPTIVYTQRNPPPGYHRWTPPPARPRSVVVVNHGGAFRPAQPRPVSVRPSSSLTVSNPGRRTPEGVRYPQPGYPQPGGRPSTGPQTGNRQGTAPVRAGGAGATVTTPTRTEPVVRTPTVQTPTAPTTAPVAGQPQGPRTPRPPRTTQPVTPGAPAPAGGRTFTPRTPAPEATQPTAPIAPTAPTSRPRYEQRTMPPSRITPPAGQNGQRRTVVPAAPQIQAPQAPAIAPAAVAPTAPVAPAAPGARAQGRDGRDGRWRSQ